MDIFIPHIVIIMYIQRLNYMLFCYIFPRPDGDLLVFVAPSRAIMRQLAMASAPTAPTSCRARSPVSRVVAHLQLPVTHRRFIRTTDLLERLFVEERRRLKTIPNGFGEKPVLKLMFGALIGATERRRGLRFTEF